MANQQSFGRRAPTLQSPRPAARARAEAPAQTPHAEPAPAEHFPPPPDEELQEWKRARPGFLIPWRPLSLMASLCFGIASFVLPDSVNDAVQWLLYALMAASFYAGIAKRRQAKV